MNSNNFIPFALPSISNEEIEEVISSLKSGWLTTGPKVKQFEKNFSEFLEEDVKCISINSATSGLHLALEALNIKEGDEVITTTHTFTATAEVIRYLGADPVLVDINLETFCIDPKLIEKKITKKTKGIIVVHFAGLCAEMNEIIKIAKKNNLFIIEDAAHALPTKYNNKLVGTFESDATVFSFYANKTITTGEGGMLVTRSKKIYERAIKMRLHGIDRDAFSRFQSNIPSWKYDIVAPGYKYNMTDIAASIGIHQLKKAFLFQKKRSAIAEIYNKNLSSLPFLLPPSFEHDPTRMHSWHLYVIRLKEEYISKRDLLINFLYENGVGCSVHYIPLHRMTYWKQRYNYKNSDFPISDKVYEASLSLPIYPDLSIESVELIVEVLQKFFKN